ncbi:hypothetical protein L207DRAFT_575527 [Hyaloscypha variabilis F]|jgi:hypothetical protein|uniref:Uncharacterized protein n=1 Tax=Hyaloscypha variabilis (strain UAMH 11265 / GT02V1 / F) TaxID=1149755 RepID=A0A2J6SDP1_HYAVF|nr:hypothetical protein L207DRAFT_575527 [Hyaloscypha variabilis F]
MNISTRQEYRRVATNDSIESFAEVPTIPTSFEKIPALNVARRKTTSLLIALATFAAVVVFITLDFAIRSSMSTSVQQPPLREDCGSSREEAISRGCTFDPLTAAWLPASCSRKWTDEFVSTIGMGYYTERHGKQAIDYAEMPFNSTYYTNRVHHVAHCIFLLLRLGDMRRDVRLDHMTLNPKHQRHCIDLILVESEHSPFAHTVQDVGHVLSGSCW